MLDSSRRALWNSAWFKQNFARFHFHNTLIFKGHQRSGPSRGRRSRGRYFWIPSWDIFQPVDPCPESFIFLTLPISEIARSQSTRILLWWQSLHMWPKYLVVFVKFISVYEKDYILFELSFMYFLYIYWFYIPFELSFSLYVSYTSIDSWFCHCQLNLWENWF